MKMMQKCAALLLVLCMALPSGAFAVEPDAATDVTTDVISGTTDNETDEPTFGTVDAADVNVTGDDTDENDADLPKMTNGTIVIEAESMNYIADAMKVVDDDKCSGGKAMKVKTAGEDGSSNYPRVNTGYDVNAEPEMYADFVADFTALNGYETIYAWAYVKMSSDGSDSMYYSINKRSETLTTYASAGATVNADYQWIELNALEYCAQDDVIRFRFQYRELGVYIDKVVFTTDYDFCPKKMTDKPGDTVRTDYDGLYPEPSVKPISGHPRVLFTRNDIPSILENAKSDDMSAIWEQTKNKARYAKDTDMKLDTTKRNYNQTYLERITNCALLYVLGESTSNMTNAECGQVAVAKAKDYLSTVRFDMALGDETRSVGQTMMMAGVVYDWCYDLLTADEKTYFIKRMKELAKKTEIGYPPNKKIVITGHGGEGEIFGYQVLCGIAVYEEDKQMYNLAAGRMFSEMLDIRKDWNKTGAHPVGGAYGATRFDWELMANQLYLGMGKDSIMGDISDLKNVAQMFIYYRLPSGAQQKVGDDYSWAGGRPRSWWTTYNTLFEFAASQTKDPYLQQANLVQQFITGAWSSTNYKSVVPDVVLTDVNTKTEFWDSLPLAKKSTAPLTSIQARTNWKMGQDSNAVVVNFEARESGDGPDHNHADTGSFQIYYKGSLTMDTGLYQGKLGEWGSSHYFNYYSRTIANNCMTVFNPNEKFTRGTSAGVYANDGGQRMTTSASSYEEYKENEPRAKTEASYIGPNTDTPEFSFVKTNLTTAYQKGKVENHERSMVFMDLDNDEYPGAVVVFDDLTSTDASYKKTFNMHSETQPTVSGNTTTITRTDNGNNGKLVNKTLLPEQSTIGLVGGEGKEFLVNGQNYPNEPSDKSQYGYEAEPEMGKWRIEISPSTSNERDLFLNAMYVTDADGNLAELPMIKEETETMVGVTVMDRCVYFSKGDQIKDKQIFNLTDNGYATVKCLVTDIKAGKWKVTQNDGTSKVYEVKDDENTLYFRATPGSCTIELTNYPAGTYTYEKMKKPVYGDFMVYNMTKTGKNNLTGAKEERRQFYALDAPTIAQGNKKLVPAKEVFEQSGGSFKQNGDKITATLDGETYYLTLGSAGYTVNGKNYLLSTAPSKHNGAIYVDAEDFFDVYYDSRAHILKLTERASNVNNGTYTLKQGETTVTKIEAVDVSQPLNIEGYVQTETAMDAVDVLCAVTKGDEVYSVSVVKTTATSTKQAFTISATGLPTDFASGGYDIMLYFWADAGTLEPVAGAISVFNQ